jgi:hypothetical protein
MNDLLQNTSAASYSYQVTSYKEGIRQFELMQNNWPEQQNLRSVAFKLGSLQRRDLFIKN